MTVKKQPMCEIHQSDIRKLEKDFDNFKVEISGIRNSLADIMDRVKNPFTIKDKLTFLAGVVIYTVIVSTAFSKTDNRSLENEKKIDKIETKIDKIYDLVYELNKKVK